MKQKSPTEKARLHPRNKHRDRYDFKTLIQSSPELKKFVIINPYGDESINFFDPASVKMLNKALLKHFYKINYWDIPEGYLCPPIPGRVDYLHYIADLLGEDRSFEIPKGEQIRGLDIGVGANCIYPILGHQEYGWSFVGTDIDKVAVESARKIVSENPDLAGHIEIRLQERSKGIFNDIIKEGEHFDFTMCNPPFHSSAEEAQAGSIKKLSNLKQQEVKKAELNFGGQSNELWCVGGEEKFVRDMISQSKDHSKQVNWFTTLISKSALLPDVQEMLKKVGATEVRVIPMGTGNKISRIVGWRY